MTDYLERLLEQQETEETDGVVEWHSVHLRGTAPNKAGVTEAAEASTAVQAAELSRLRERVSGAAQLLQQVQRLHRAVRQAEVQDRRAVDQVQRLHRTVRQAEIQDCRTVAAQGMTPWEGINGQAAATLSARRTADYAAAVDMAFQRDARRYDGPLGLL